MAAKPRKITYLSVTVAFGILCAIYFMRQPNSRHVENSSLAANIHSGLQSRIEQTADRATDRATDIQCLVAGRRDLVAHVCKSRRVFSEISSYQPPIAKKGFTDLLKARRREPIMHGVIVSQKHNIFFCQIQKTGVFASREFFMRENGGNLTRFASYGEFKGQSLEGRGVMVKEFPAKKVKEDYSNYRKMLIMRHPLQRMVAAYYQVVVLGVGGGHLKNFADFIVRGVLNPDWFDVHVIPAHEACFPCYIHYDVILRTETLDEEFPALSASLGLGTGVAFGASHINPNFKSNSTFKYDPILQNFEKDHPELFQKVLDKYSMDMELFGYSWENHKSGIKESVATCP